MQEVNVASLGGNPQNPTLPCISIDPLITSYTNYHPTLGAK